MKPAVTLNPHTPVSLLEEILPDLDMVLLMSVNPGFGGQQFIEHSVKKVSQLKEMILRQQTSTLIEVDGGVNLDTGRRLVDAGADVALSREVSFFLRTTRRKPFVCCVPCKVNSLSTLTASSQRYIFKAVPL